MHLEVQEVPEIILKPRSVVNLKGGDSVSLECLAIGSPKPILMWMHEKDRTVLLPGNLKLAFYYSLKIIYLEILNPS